jgi:hypothetical protein
VKAHPWERWSLLSGRRSGRSLPRSWWSKRAPEVLEASGPVPSAAAAEDEAGTAAGAAGTAGSASAAAAAAACTVPRPGVATRRSRSHLPLLVLNLPAFALGVEGSVEAVVHERVLQVVIESLQKRSCLSPSLATSAGA